MCVLLTVRVGACCCRALAAGGGVSAASVSDLQELRALLLDAKAENEQLKAERDQVGWAAAAAQGVS
jgi:cell division protein FtsB